MRSGEMGTQPTNAGIDFQQRVSAWILINMLTDMNLNLTIKLDKETYIKKVALESNEIIDDLVVITNENEKIYFQMKRTVSLTTGEKTDFYKAIYQFVKEYLINDSSNSKFILVTSSSSSNPVKEELRKILDSIRLNPITFIENPLTKNEAASYSKFKQLIEDIYESISKKQITADDYQKLIGKIYIQVLDIEEGMPFEQAVLIMINSKVNHVSPQDFWSVAIKSCLSWASQRLTITKESLQELWKPYLIQINHEKSEEDEIKKYFEFVVDGDFEMGRDIVLVKPLTQVPSYIKNLHDVEGSSNINYEEAFYLLELFRFDDLGQKKLQYFDSDKIMLGKDWVLEVIFRSATIKGVERFLKENPELVDDTDLIVIGANDTEFVEGDVYVKSYKEKCRHILKSNYSLKCIHCSKGISANHSYIVEVDDFYEELVLGLIHDECRRPNDRILGIVNWEAFEKFDFLINFDYEGWISNLQNSQAFIGGINQVTQTYNAVMVWDPYNYPNNAFDYCIKIYLKNGDFRYSKIRGKVDRLNKSGCKQQVKQFNERFQKERWCYTSKSNIFGLYEVLIKSKRLDEDILECDYAEMVRFNEHIAKQHNDFNNFYAPLCYLVDIRDELIICINRMPVLISNPFDLNHYFKNWGETGIEINEYEVKIIYTDSDFDNFMKDIVRDGLRPILNPQFDNKGNLISGVSFMHINDRVRI